MNPTESEIACLHAIERAARAYVEWADTCPREPDPSWIDQAVFLRGELREALAGLNRFLSAMLKRFVPGTAEHIAAEAALLGSIESPAPDGGEAGK